MDQSLEKDEYELARMRARQKILDATIEYVKFTGIASLTVPVEIEGVRLLLMVARRDEVMATILS